MSINYNINISKESVLIEDFRDIFDLIHEIISKPDGISEAQNSWNVNFPDYGDAPEKLPDIPEVVNWIERSLDIGVPWFYFLKLDKDDPTLKTFVKCCALNRNTLSAWDSETNKAGNSGAESTAEDASDNAGNSGAESTAEDASDNAGNSGAESTAEDASDKAGNSGAESAAEDASDNAGNSGADTTPASKETDGNISNGGYKLDKYRFDFFIMRNLENVRRFANKYDIPAEVVVDITEKIESCFADVV